MLLAAACSSGASPVSVAPPGGGAGEACPRLHRALPDDLDGRGGRDTRPGSDRTAAWGDPPVVLRCGVARPAGLTATSELIEIDGVAWFLAERPRAYVFTTFGRSAYVEVRVPRSTPREQATSPLVDLAPAVQESLPRT